MYWSRYLAKTFKNPPADAHIKSHQLLIQGGFVESIAAGMFAWLPLGLRVLKRIETIVREEQDKAGAIELLMPTLQPAELWHATGRYDAYGAEMLRVHDRSGRTLVYGPTAEDIIAEVVKRLIGSYRDLPLTVYNVQWKFRDERRPRFGVMRAREFLMKDGYSFDISEKDAQISYEKMLCAYLRTFRRIGVTAIPVRASTGPIGGDLSHEFHILASTGESTIYYDPLFETYQDDKAPPKHWEAFEKDTVPSEAMQRLKESKAIEVGHIFYYGPKYSQAIKATVTHKNGQDIFPYGGCYGIGISRLVGALVECFHDATGICWPLSVAPFVVGLVALPGTGVSKVAEAIYRVLTQEGHTVLYDDREESSGVKFADMDLIGLPFQIIIGPRGVANGTVEIKERASGERIHLQVEEVGAWAKKTLCFS